MCVAPYQPWKQDLAARMALEALMVVYGASAANESLARPRLLGTSVDFWNPSWKDFHFGYGSVGGICMQQPWLEKAWGSPCFGIRLQFDSPLAVEGALDRFHRGLPSGFELGLAAPGIEPEWQPLTLFGLRDGNTTVQLNGTAAPFGGVLPNGSMAVFEVVGLRYAWHDYPSMVLLGARSRRPVAPFRARLVASSTEGAPELLYGAGVPLV